MKVFASILILLYGALVTYGVVIAIAFGNSFSGASDGATVGHTISLAAAWPSGVYFLLAAVGPFVTRGERAIILVTTLVVLFVSFLTGASAASGLFLASGVAALSLLVWIPLIFGPAPTSQPD